MERVTNEEDEFEISFYEGIIKNKPDFIEALVALGDLYTRNGYYTKGLIVDQKLEVLCPDDPVVLYNLACSYSLLNRIDESLAVVKRAVKKGYTDFQHMKADTDLDNLRKDKRFKQYLTRIQKKLLLKADEG